MAKFRAIYSSTSYYPVVVEADNEEDAKVLIEAVVHAADEGMEDDEVNEMYDKHWCDDEFTLVDIREM